MSLQTDFFDLPSPSNQDELSENSVNNASTLTENEVFIGKLLFRLINVMPCNTHDISEFETPVMDRFVPGCKKVSLGMYHSTKIAFFFSGQLC